MQLQKYWKGNFADKLTITLFSVYLLAVAWILLFKLGVHFSYMENRVVNVFPFREAFRRHGKIDLPELIMNVIIFVPMGIYVGVLWREWTAGRRIFIFFLASLLLELIQFIGKIGAFDITDMITNTAGGITGLLLYKLLEKLVKQPDGTQKLINVIAALGTGVMVLLLILLKTNHLGIRYQ